MNKIILNLFLAFIYLQVFPQATFNSNVASTGTWNNAGSWTLVSGSDGDGIPDGNDNAVILSGDIITIPAGTRNVNNLTVNSSSILRFNTASGILEFTNGGNLTVATGGAIDNTVDGTRLRFLGDHTITFNGSINIDFYTFTGANGAVTFNGIGASVTDRLEINNDCTITFNHTGSYTIVSALNIDYEITLEGSGILTLTGGSNGTDINMRNVAFPDLGNLTIDCEINIEDDIAIIGDDLTVTIGSNGNISVGSDLRIGPNGTSSDNFTLNINTGGFLDISNQVILDEDLTETAHDFVLNNSGEIDITNNIDFNDQFRAIINNNGTITLTGNIVDASSGVNAATFNNNTNATFNLIGNIDNNVILNFNSNGNTVNYFNAGTQTIEDPISSTYHHLTISTSGTKSLSSTLDVQGDLTISGTSIFNLNGNNLSVGGDWINSSTNADPLAQGTATITFNGSNAQNINNSGDAQGTEFYDLIINNTASGFSDISLNADVVITNDLELIDGIVVTSSSNSLTVNSTASVTLSGSPQDNSFISGPLVRVVSSSALTNLEFPIGKDGIYRRVDLNIDQNNTNTTSYSSEVFNTSGAGLYNQPVGIERISSVRYYTINQSPSTVLDGAQVRIYYGDDDGVEDPPTLTIVKQNGTDWEDITGSAAGIPAGSILSGTFTSFSDFALASTSLLNPLPIELLSFNAKLIDGTVQLNWSTSSEINNDYFTVEKTKGFQYYETVAVVSGSGTSSEILHYQSEDKYPYPDITYYRLKQTDFDGMFSYSKIISIENDRDYSPAITLYPNPTNQYVNLRTAYFYEDQLQVRILNSTGEILVNTTLEKEANSQFDDEISLKDLPKGLYVVELSSTGHSSIKKLIIR